MKNLLNKFVIAIVCCIAISAANAAIGFTAASKVTAISMTNSLVNNYSNWGDFASVWNAADAKGDTAFQTNMLSAAETALNKLYKNRDKSKADKAVIQACINAIEATGCLSCTSKPVGTNPVYLSDNGGKGKTNVTWYIEWNKNYNGQDNPILSRKANAAN